jgi:hypothetical protein
LIAELSAEVRESLERCSLEAAEVICQLLAQPSVLFAKIGPNTVGLFVDKRGDLLRQVSAARACS